MSFSANNQNPLTFSYQYPYHGWFQVVANCSNQISFVLANTFVKVGENMRGAKGMLRNQYAHVTEPVNVVVRIDGGNGYSIVADFGDSNRMYLPWTYLNSSGAQIGTTLFGYVAPKASFHSDGVYISYSYLKSGQYDVIHFYVYIRCL